MSHRARDLLLPVLVPEYWAFRDNGFGELQVPDAKASSQTSKSSVNFPMSTELPPGFAKCRTFLFSTNTGKGPEDHCKESPT